MRLRLLLLFIVNVFLLTSCEDQKTEQEVLIIREIYNEAILKELPPPPPPVEDSELGSAEDSVDFSNLKSLKFKYAINKRFIATNLDKGLNNVFTKYKSKKFFDRKQLSDSEMEIVNRVSQLKLSESMNIQLIKEEIDDDILFLDQKFIDKSDKKKHKINAIISFTNIAFSNDMKEAALGVVVYGSGLDSSYKLYILEKISNKWEIKYYKILSVS